MQTRTPPCLQSAGDNALGEQSCCFSRQEGQEGLSREIYTQYNKNVPNLQVQTSRSKRVFIHLKPTHACALLTQGASSRDYSSSQVCQPPQRASSFRKWQQHTRNYLPYKICRCNSYRAQQGKPLYLLSPGKHFRYDQGKTQPAAKRSQHKLKLLFGELEEHEGTLPTFSWLSFSYTSSLCLLPLSSKGQFQHSLDASSISEC